MKNFALAVALVLSCASGARAQEGDALGSQEAAIRALVPYSVALRTIPTLQPSQYDSAVSLLAVDLLLGRTFAADYQALSESARLAEAHSAVLKRLHTLALNELAAKFGGRPFRSASEQFAEEIQQIIRRMRLAGVRVMETWEIVDRLLALEMAQQQTKQVRVDGKAYTVSEDATREDIESLLAFTDHSQVSGNWSWDGTKWVTYFAGWDPNSGKAVYLPLPDLHRSQADQSDTSDETPIRVAVLGYGIAQFPAGSPEDAMKMALKELSRQPVPGKSATAPGPIPTSTRSAPSQPVVVTTPPSNSFGNSAPANAATAATELILQWAAARAAASEARLRQAQQDYEAAQAARADRQSRSFVHQPYLTVPSLTPMGSSSAQSSSIGQFGFYSDSSGVTGTSTAVGPFTFSSYSNGVSATATQLSPFTYYRVQQPGVSTTVTGTSTTLGQFQLHNFTNGVSGSTTQVGQFGVTSLSNGKRCVTTTLGKQTFTTCY